VAAKKKMSGNTLLGLGLLLCGAVVVVALVGSRFLKSDPPPPPPPPPPSAEKTVTGILRFTEGFYKAQLDDDTKRFGLPPVTVAELAKPLPYAVELAKPKRLKADHDKLETDSLRLQTHVRKEWAMTANGQGFKYEHMILEITNKLDRPVAYLVETSVPKPEKCKSKGAMPHNAVVLGPLESLQRTECLWNPGMELTIKRIETLALTDLGYQYVSRLVPQQILLDDRTSAGHTPAKGQKPCAFIPWRDIQADATAKTGGWDDVIDFYARHNCDEYSYWRGYQRWTAPGALPSRAENTPAPAPAPTATPEPGAPPAAPAPKGG